jgi:hypothetical protein
MLAMIIQNRSRAGYFLVHSCAARVSPEEAARWPRWAFTITGAALVAFLIIVNYGHFTPYSFQHTEESKTGPAVKADKATILQPPHAALPAFSESVAKESGLTKHPAPEVKNSMEKPASPRKIPAILGQLTVERNDYVLKILERIYGKEAFSQLGYVSRINPHIKDLDWVRKGDVINIPVRLKASSPLPQGKHWVQIAALSNLKSAYDLSTTSYNLPRCFLLSYWTEKEGVTFAVLLKEGFEDETAALSAIKALPQPFAGTARVVNGWHEGTMFL